MQIGYFKTVENKYASIVLGSDNGVYVIYEGKIYNTFRSVIINGITYTLRRSRFDDEKLTAKISKVYTVNKRLIRRKRYAKATRYYKGTKNNC